MDLDDQIFTAVQRRDYTRAAQLEALRREPPPPFRGGQGRTDEDIEREGEGALCWAVGAVLVALGLLAYGLAFGGGS